MAHGFKRDKKRFVIITKTLVSLQKYVIFSIQISNSRNPNFYDQGCRFDFIMNLALAAINFYLKIDKLFQIWKNSERHGIFIFLVYMNLDRRF